VGNFWMDSADVRGRFFFCALGGAEGGAGGRIGHWPLATGFDEPDGLS
jgi:hypothetical protein